MVLLNVAFLLSYFIRYGLPFPEVNITPYKDNFAFMTFMYMLAFIFSGVFRRKFRSKWDVFKRIFVGLFIGSLFGIALVYVFRIKWGYFPSSIFVISFPVGLLLLFYINTLILKYVGRIKKKVVVIGKTDVTDFLENKDFVQKTYIDKLEDMIQHEDADEVLICERLNDDVQLNLLIFLLLKLKVNVVFSPSLYAELLSGNLVEQSSAKYLTTFIGRKSDFEEFIIRIFDLAVSLFTLLFISPLILFVTILIKVDSKGPVLYKQSRIAKDGKTFTLYKFRTMIDNAEVKSGPVLASKNDERVTNIGRFLRETRIDEIPQFINVIRGDMSLVGPRPERPYFVKLHKALREIRLAVKPGLTGLAQIRSYYNLHPNHKIKYDYLYIQKRSLLLNIYILAKTIPIVLLRKGT
jgi:lipopolysaccharide/colanic/teichoic acid biosynthesis glycosyltransferase